MEKTALILEGGGLRGIYTGGVLDRMMERKIWFPYVIGVSAGACNATSYVSRQQGRAGRTLLNYISNPRYCGWSQLLLTGSMFNMDFLFDEIPNRLDPFDFKAFAESDVEFELPVTNLNTGMADYFCKDNVMGEKLMLLRATSSIPLISRIVRYHGQPYLDGAIADPIPVQRALDCGCTRCVIILTRPRGYLKHPLKQLAPYRMRYHAYPAFLKALERRHTVYNEALRLIDTLERNGKALVIAPEFPAPFAHYERNADKLRRYYEAGRADMDNVEARLRAFCNHSHNMSQSR